MGYNYTDAVFSIKEFTQYDDENGSEPLVFTATDKAVLNALAHYANNETGECYPGYGRLSEVTLYSRSTVIRSIERLKEFEFITVDTNTGRGSNNYKLHMDKLVAAGVLPPDPRGKKKSGKKFSRKNYKRKPKVTFNIEDDEKQELEFLDESKTVSFNIEVDDELTTE
jgi:hypothetical protein